MRAEHKAEMKARKRNIALLVAYDGTNYNGFQRQRPPIQAIQNILEERLEKIFGDSIELSASGRTDSGVHALGQVVNFFTDGRIETEKIPRAAAGYLPPDIIVRDAWEEDKNFSSLHSAKSKIYIYRIQTGATVNPFAARFSWHIPYPLDVQKMSDALKILVGTHDFSAFKAAGGAPMNPVRTIYSAEIFPVEEFDADILQIKIHSTGFLYHMARNIVSAVVAVGRERMTLPEFLKIFKDRDRSPIPATAPAHGLCLYKVFYS